MDNSFGSLVGSAKSILVVLSTNPSFDEVASGLSLYESLAASKDAAIYCPTPMVVAYNRLFGVDKVVHELGNKNLTLKFKSYDANQIEKVSYDIQDGEFKLTVVPKTGNLPPTRDQIDTTYSGISFDTVILVGGTGESVFPIAASPDLANTKFLHIGITTLSLPGQTILSFAKAAPAVSEVAATLIREGGLHLEPDVASNLIAGIEEGTSFFKGKGVTPETFEITASLMREGGKRTTPSTPSFDGSASAPVSFSEPQPGEPQNPPKDWLEPKIFKGTSVS